MAASPQEIQVRATEAESLAQLAAQISDLTAMLKRENDGGLSPAEVAMIPEANVRADPAEAEAASKAAARKIIAEFMFDAQLEWDDLIASAWAGEMAAKLYATWWPVNVMEPVCEADGAEQLPAAIQAAMAAKGGGKYAEKCEILGRFVAENAMSYLFQCHGMIDADLAREDAAEMESEYRRMISPRGEG